MDIPAEKAVKNRNQDHVTIVENESPPITVTPMGFQVSEPSPPASARGIIPKSVVNVVIKTGRKR